MGYRCRYLSGEVTLSEEHVSYRWVSRDDYVDVDDGSPPFAALRYYFETVSLATEA